MVVGDAPGEVWTCRADLQHSSPAELCQLPRPHCKPLHALLCRCTIHLLTPHLLVPHLEAAPLLCDFQRCGLVLGGLLGTNSSSTSLDIRKDEAEELPAAAECPLASTSSSASHEPHRERTYLRLPHPVPIPLAQLRQMKHRGQAGTHLRLPTPPSHLHAHLPTPPSHLHAHLQLVDHRGRSGVPAVTVSNAAAPPRSPAVTEAGHDIARLTPTSTITATFLDGARHFLMLR
ncbi:hypothetical protein M758_UG156000 [Ceratodon purpureus]|nr:hypothetical protein M758_UG156000 [Ceratodon purpureus]